MKFERNEWESEFFGREIYSLIFDEHNQILPPLAGEVVEHSETEGGKFVKFYGNSTACSPLPPASQGTSPASGGRIGNPILIQTKIPTTDLNKLVFLQQHGFQLVETEITFSLDIANFSENLTACNVRIATEQDLPSLKNLVATAFRNTRFREPYFSQAENQRFYQQWIENAAKGEFDDFCLIAEQQEELQGAISLRFLGDKAKIGLLAVSPEFQRQGIGKGLLFATIWQAKSQHAKSLEITTQLSNIPAIQLYQSLSAKITEMNYWFYQ